VIVNSCLPNTQLDYERDGVDVCRLAVGVMFALVVKLGAKMFVELLARAGCDSVLGPTSGLREVIGFVPRGVPALALPKISSLVGRIFIPTVSASPLCSIEREQRTPFA
jgi:hypothetical protein